MRFKPILFSTEMVSAILEGRKTQTRRLVKPQPTDDWMKNTKQFSSNGSMFDPKGKQIYWINNPAGGEIKCPYGSVSDILWVRETWAPVSSYPEPDCFGAYLFKSMGDMSEKWRPSIFMPKSACRIFLQIIDIRVERLQDISEEDAKAEGIRSFRPVPGDGPAETQYYHYIKNKWGPSPIHSYETLWRKINGVNSWSANPWVWAISFTRIDKPEGFV